VTAYAFDAPPPFFFGKPAGPLQHRDGAGALPLRQRGLPSRGRTRAWRSGAADATSTPRPASRGDRVACGIEGLGKIETVIA
jgi:hypothetical protein